MNLSELMENEMKNVHTHSLGAVCARRYHYDEGKNGIDVTLRLIPVYHSFGLSSSSSLLLYGIYQSNKR